MKKLLIILGVLVALLVIAYVIGTRSGVVKAVVLPRIGAALNARVDADSIGLSPFSSVEIHNLTIVPNGAEPLAKVDLARVRYSLWDLIRGRMNFDEILVSNPTVTVVQKADGTSNLDPVLKRLEENARTGTEKPAGSAPQVNLTRVRVENANLSYRATAADGSTRSAEINRLAIQVRDVRNGGKGHLEVAGGLKFDQHPGAGPGGTGMAGVQAQIDGAFDVTFAADLFPTTATGRTEMQVQQAVGTLADYQGFTGVLSVDLTPTELKRLALEFSRNGNALGSITANGPLNLAQKEGHVQVEVAAIDRNVLNLVGTPMGLDFVDTRFDSSNRIDIEAGGQRYGIRGSVTGARFGVRKGALAMPPVDLKEAHELSIDLGAEAIVVRGFSLAATQAGREILQGRIAQPMEIRWATNHPPLPDATIQLSLNALQLTDWSALLGAGTRGTVNARADLGIRRGGQDLVLDGTTAVNGLTGEFAGSGVTNLTLHAVAQATVPNFANAAERRLSGRAEVTNLTGQAAMLTFTPASPLAVGLTLDAGWSEGHLDLRTCELRFTPTARATNSLRVTGTLDLSKPEALKGALAWSADSLDVTPLYDAFAGGPQSAAATNQPPAAPQKEPEPIQLPVESLTLNGKVGKLFLREVEVGNLTADVKIDHSRIDVQPLKLALNGAPVSGSAQLDLGVPGFKYDFKITGDQVPVKPFANSFIPLLKDRIGGTAQAKVDVQGAGITGVNLKKSLAGGLSFGVTNANLKLTDAGSRKGVLSLLTSLLAAALNIRELQDQPIMDLTAQAKLGDGLIAVHEARFRSASIEGGIAGNIPIADDLMKSPLNFPVNLAMNRELAERARLVGAEAPTNSAYVPIPDIASIEGTIGEPSPKIDKVKTALFVARGLGGLLGSRTSSAVLGATNAVGNLIQGIGGVLRGKGDEAGTNAPVTNAVGNLIKGIGGLFGGKKNPPPATNAPPANTNAVKDPKEALPRNAPGKK